jgi:RNA polymerase-interacting CarD/CdnL/TRCF family regulator
MSDMFPCTIEEQIAEVERELAKRRQVYPHQIADKKMSEAAADLHMRRMAAVLDTLRSMKEASK